MVKFNIPAMYPFLPGYLHAKQRRFVLRRLAGMVEAEPFKVTPGTERTRRGWIGTLTVEFFGAEVVYPAVRNFSPNVILVGPRTEATPHLNEESALSLAKYLKESLEAQLHDEVSKREVHHQ